MTDLYLYRRFSVKMTPEKLNELTRQSEGIEVEFKTSRFELSKDTFETICAFLNRQGGHLLLGVKDNGTVEGILESSVENIINNIITNANNSQKLNPPFYLSPQVLSYKDKNVIYLYVPESSQVHNANGKIFDRNKDGDLDITKNHDQVTQLYLRKQSTYSENKVFPYVEPSDFNSGLFKRIRTNLIESYDRLMAFIQKHLPDKFYQENTNRISLRDRLFREVISNLLIHREFSNAYPAKLIIEKERVYTENWNRPHGSGAIDPANFSPYPKNPVIARFFKEIGRVDELGSGIRNSFKYCGIYSPRTKPEFIEGDIFKTIIPLKAEKILTVSDWKGIRKRLGDRLGDWLGDSEWQILEIIWSNPTASITEMAESIGISTTAIEKNIKKLKEKGVLERMGSTKKGYWKIKEV